MPRSFTDGAHALEVKPCSPLSGPDRPLQRNGRQGRPDAGGEAAREIRHLRHNFPRVPRRAPLRLATRQQWLSHVPNPEGHTQTAPLSARAPPWPLPIEISEPIVAPREAIPLPTPIPFTHPAEVFSATCGHPAADEADDGQFAPEIAVTEAS